MIREQRFRLTHFEIADSKNREAVQACSRGREPTEDGQIQIESREAAAAHDVQLFAVTPSGFIDSVGVRSAG